VARIIPFRGYRYDAAKVGSISDVVSPPYDRVYPDVQEACYGRSPYNVVRIIKGKEEPGDDGERNVYTRASEALRAWIAGGVLIRDRVPGLYAYHQTYRFGGERLTRKGIVALGKLEPEKVHAHERTLKGPREDRLRLMRATEANFGHIFMLYCDPERRADRAMAAATEGRAPDVVAEDADGNEHRVWCVTDEEAIGVAQAGLADKDLYIADGHHRYETAVNYLRECEAAGWKPAAPESFDARMMTLFNIDEPGMSIRPIHRLVHGVEAFDAKSFLRSAEGNFEVVRHPTMDSMEAAVSSGRPHTFGCVTKDAFATLTLRDSVDLDSLIREDRSREYKSLDVSILHAGVLEGLLGVDAVALEEQTHVRYAVDAREGVEAVASGSEQLLLYLRATSAAEVVRVADRGEKMPQKSTDFYPKLLTGLVLSVMEIDKGT
jgi:uncharacterized protein (DUF1015 family)